MTREEREEAIEYIKKYRELDAKLYQNAPFNTIANNALTKCLRYWDMAIQALEQEKTGHWIWCGGSHMCSNCNEYTCFAEKHPPKYCPNCGAKMEVKKSAL